MYKKASIPGSWVKSLDNPGISGWLVSMPNATKILVYHSLIHILTFFQSLNSV